MPLLTLKRVNGLKTSDGDTFDKRCVFLAKSTCFLRFLTLKQKNEIKIVKTKKTRAAFNPKTRKWA